MRDTYAILALRGKRAYLAGEIAKAEQVLAVQRKVLATVDATIQRNPSYSAGIEGGAQLWA